MPCCSVWLNFFAGKLASKMPAYKRSFFDPWVENSDGRDLSQGMDKYKIARAIGRALSGTTRRHVLFEIEPYRGLPPRLRRWRDHAGRSGGRTVQETKGCRRQRRGCMTFLRCFRRHSCADGIGSPMPEEPEGVTIAERRGGRTGNATWRCRALVGHSMMAY